MKKLTLFLVLVFGISFAALAQRADLTGIKICIDPGHGGHNAANDRHLIPDPGTDFWESESNFQKALALKALLEAKGATVILTRNTNDYPSDNDPSLSARVALANANNVTWFHSIHSNATGQTVNTSTNSTLMLVREKIVPGGDAVYGPGMKVPEWQEAWDISNIIGPYIRSKMKTTGYSRSLDLTFYSFATPPYTLGVLRGLLMPGELSEGEFHDYFPETRRLMNLSHCKMEAYAIRDAFLTYFGVPADSLCIVAGELSESGTNKLIDGTKVRLLPENIVYTGDLYHNGYYMIDGFKAGPHTLRFETPGFKADSVQFTVGIGETRFIDKQFESTAAPVVISTTPANNDTSFVASGQIQIMFSKIMDTASVRSAFSIAPLVRGTLVWTAANSVLTFKPDSVVLPFNTSFTLRIEGTARSQSGLGLDANGDGSVGDALVLKFKTRPVDVWPPALVTASPASGSTNVSPNVVLNFTYDEPLDPASVSSTNIVLQEVGGGIKPLTYQYDLRNGRGGINMYPQGGFVPGKSYRVRISGIRDLFGNPIPATNPLHTFSVAAVANQVSSIESFTSSLSSWFQPATSGSTIGINADSTVFTLDTLLSFPLLPPSAHSARVSYSWDVATATDWLIREYLNAGPGRLLIWGKQGTKLQSYVYGDGSGTLLRFAVDDSVDAFPGGSAPNHEVSQWVAVNWVGWRLVEWDFEHDSLGTWIGNGKLEGSLRFDSYQLKYVPGTSPRTGAIFFALLQVVKGTIVSVESTTGERPAGFALMQNFPNPFNPSTVINYQLSTVGQVSLRIYDMLGREIATVVNEMGTPGMHTAVWNGKNDRGESVASGIYLYKLQAGSSVSTKKMILMK